MHDFYYPPEICLDPKKPIKRKAVAGANKAAMPSKRPEDKPSTKDL